MAQKDTTIHELSSKLEFNDSSTKKYAEQVRLHPTNKQFWNEQVVQKHDSLTLI